MERLGIKTTKRIVSVHHNNAMARMLRPEKIHGQYMTAVARYSYNPQVKDGCTGKPFE
jgi:hypothetical protein